MTNFLTKKPYISPNQPSEGQHSEINKKKLIFHDPISHVISLATTLRFSGASSVNAAPSMDSLIMTLVHSCQMLNVCSPNMPSLRVAFFLAVQVPPEQRTGKRLRRATAARRLILNCLQARSAQAEN